MKSATTLCFIITTATFVSACGQGDRISQFSLPQGNIVSSCDNLTKVPVVFREFTDEVKAELHARDYASCLKKDDGLGYLLVVNAPKETQAQVFSWLNSVTIADYKVATKTTMKNESEINLVRISKPFEGSCEIWQDLISHRPSQEIQSGLLKLAQKVSGKFQALYKYTKFRPVESAAHKIINLDLYQIVVYQAPSRLDGQEISPTMLGIFRYLMDNMNRFSPKGVNFYHYCDDKIIESGLDSICSGGDPRTNPRIYPGEIIHIQLSKGWFAHDDGTVIATKKIISKTEGDIIFSTADSILDSNHPVSGNRNFGFAEFPSLDRPVARFYIRGADRITYSQFADSMIKILSKGILDGGDQAWLSVQKKLVAKINEGGGRAEIVRQEQFYRPNWEDVKMQCFRPTVPWDPLIILQGPGTN